MTDGLRTLDELDPAKLYILPLGVGYAFTRRFYHSSFLMVCGGKTTLIDAPAPLRRVMWAAGRNSGFDIDLQHIDNLFLTHLHGDHCNGVEEFAFWRMFQSNAPKPNLYLLKELRAPLWFQRLYAAMGSVREGEDGSGPLATLDTYFEVKDLHAGVRTDLGIDGLTLEPRKTRHFVPTIGFKMNFNGHVLAYSADTPFDRGLINFFEDADLIIHETGYGGGHCPIEKLLELPEEIKAKMLLIHLPDDFNIEDSEIPVLREGHLYEVGAGRDPILA